MDTPRILRSGHLRCLLAAGMLLLASTELWASGPRPQSPAALDVRVVVDVSGSMNQSDPEGMLAPALQLFLELLPLNSRAGVWTFGQQVNALVRHAPVTALWRTQALAKTAKLPAVGLRTALGAAIDQAAWDWQAPAPGMSRHIILLTDGEVDLADSSAVNQAARTALLQTRLPELAAAGYQIHTMALSDRGDVAFLKEAAQLSGGQFLSPGSPATLPEDLVQLFSSIGPAERIPVRPRGLANTSAANPGQSALPAAAPGSAMTFQVEPGVDEVTVFIIREAGQQLSLSAPEGENYDRARVPKGSRWHISDGYELLTLAQPAPGSWTLSGAAAQVFSYGSLQLRLLDRPRRIAPGTAQSLGFTLESSDPGVPLAPDFLQLVTFSAVVESDQGQPLAAVERSEDGQLQVLLSRLQGVEQAILTLQAKGPTFERLVRLPFTVAHPLRAEVHPASKEGVGGTLWVTLNQPGLAPGSARIAAGLQQSPAAQRWYPLKPQPAGMWRVELPAALEGNVEIELDVHAKYLNDGEFNYRSDVLSITLPVAAPERFSFAQSGRLDQPPALTEPPPEAPIASSGPELPPPADALDSGAVVAEPALTAAEALAAAAASEPEAEPAQVPVWFAGVGMLLPLLLLAGLGWGLSRLSIKRVDAFDLPEPEGA